MRSCFTIGLLTVTLGASLLAAGTRAAQASSCHRRNSAFDLGPSAAYERYDGERRSARRYDRYGSDGYGYDRRYDRFSSGGYGSERRSRYRGSSYRSGRSSGQFQFPDGNSSGGYYGSGGYQSQNGGSYGNGGYQSQYGGSYGKSGSLPPPNGGYQYQNGGSYGQGGQYGSAPNLPGFSRRHRRHSD
jgi:hypothetical protein